MCPIAPLPFLAPLLQTDVALIPPSPNLLLSEELIPIQVLTIACFNPLSYICFGIVTFCDMVQWFSAPGAH